MLPHTGATAPWLGLTAAAAQRPVHGVERDGLSLQAHVARGAAAVGGLHCEDNLSAFWALQQVACRWQRARHRSGWVGGWIGRVPGVCASVCSRERERLAPIIPGSQPPHCNRLCDMQAYQGRAAGNGVEPMPSQTLPLGKYKVRFTLPVNCAASGGGGGRASLTPTCGVQRQRAGGLPINGQDLVPRPDAGALGGAARRRRNDGQRRSRPRLRLERHFHPHARHRALRAAPAAGAGRRGRRGKRAWNATKRAAHVRGSRFAQGPRPCRALKPRPLQSTAWNSTASTAWNSCASHEHGQPAAASPQRVVLVGGQEAGEGVAQAGKEGTDGVVRLLPVAHGRLLQSFLPYLRATRTGAGQGTAGGAAAGCLCRAEAPGCQHGAAGSCAARPWVGLPAEGPAHKLSFPNNCEAGIAARCPSRHSEGNVGEERGGSTGMQGAPLAAGRACSAVGCPGRRLGAHLEPVLPVELLVHEGAIHRTPGLQEQQLLLGDGISRRRRCQRRRQRGSRSEGGCGDRRGAATRHIAKLLLPGGVVRGGKLLRLLLLLPAGLGLSTAAAALSRQAPAAVGSAPVVAGAPGR